MATDDSSVFRLLPRPAPPGHQHVGSLAVITCLFNPCGYRTTLANYHRFAEGLQNDNVPLFTAELAFDETPFVLPERPNILRLRTRHVMWHKERLLNLLLKSAPRSFTKIAWVDADLLFENSRWAVQAEELLNDVPVVQLFETAEHLDRSERPEGLMTGIAAGVARGRRIRNGFGGLHPGFAWAVRRDLLDRHGLLDPFICGGADSLMVCAMYGWWNNCMVTMHTPGLQSSFRQWAQPFWKDVQNRVGAVPGLVRHLWHGDRHHRQYSERTAWLRHVQFDPLRDLRAGRTGLWEWNAGTDWLQRQIREYFVKRREDG